jgi:hypothetical protein
MAGALRLELNMIDTARTAYFKDAAGEVHPVKLPAVDAVLTCRKHPHEWSLTPDTFAEPADGFMFSEGDGGGRGRISGASVKAD